MNAYLKQREKAGMRQQDVADAVGVTRSTVGKWETGVAHPSVDVLKKLRALFKCSADDLLAEDEEPEY